MLKRSYILTHLPEPKVFRQSLRILYQTGNDMPDVTDHYEHLLAEHYSWLYGGLEQFDSMIVQCFVHSRNYGPTYAAKHLSS